MADRPLYVRFPDGEIRHGIYRSSVDRALPELFPTREAGKSARWRHGERYDYDETVDGSGEPVELATSYGGGFYWAGKATRDWITSGRDPFDDVHSDGTPLWLAQHFGDGILRLADSLSEAVPAWLPHPVPGEPSSPTHLRVLDAYCAELGIDAESARHSWMTMMEAVRWWNSGAPELYKGPTAAGEALAKFDASMRAHEDGEGSAEYQAMVSDYRAMLVRQDRDERLARVMPDPARPGWRALRSKHAPAVEEARGE